jgi:hypothetical protein
MTREPQWAPGTEWLKDRPVILERVYSLTKSVFARAYPPLKRISPSGIERVMVWSERLLKGWIFDCRMCGQCMLHSSGMTCPMVCPKELRNGPCGGVRPDGHCEVIPDMPCVWVQAWERGQRMTVYADDLRVLQPPLNNALQNTSAWINVMERRDIQAPPGWGAPAGEAETASRQL